jgi:hypothetical protein
VRDLCATQNAELWQSRQHTLPATSDYDFSRNLFTGVPDLVNFNRLGVLGALALTLLASTQAARAQAIGDEQEWLFQQMVRQPSNYDVTMAYVRVATERGDYEAAIGALERLLYYNPNLALVKYELGTLYFRLRSFDMARRYFLEALATPGLDEATRARIAVYLPDTERQSQRSRFAGFAHTGARYQSNANFAPTGDTVRVGGIDLGLPSTTSGRSDWNWFGLVGLSHDFDLQDRLGTVFESRFAGYATKQFRLDDLDVGLVDGSFGPRIPIPAGIFAGASIKPYVAGGNIWVDGDQYLTSGGAGVGLALQVTQQWVLEPVFEWRRVDFTNQFPTFADFSTGDWYTYGVASRLALADRVRLDARGFYREGDGSMPFHDFTQWLAEAALTFHFAPPFPSIPRLWSVSPFAKYIRTEFDAPNPSIDEDVTRRDTHWVAGIIFDTPISRTFGIKTVVQYDKVESTLPNYRHDNYSVLSGPTARF